MSGKEGDVGLSYETLKAGQKYRIRYQIEGLHRVPREGVAEFLSWEQPPHTDERRKVEMLFSGRPEFGTTQIEVGWVLAMWEVDGDTKCYMDKKVKPEQRVY